ncbi:MAG: hypothetical protein V3V12_06780 [Gammaproteobacteria bacterium]
MFRLIAVSAVLPVALALTSCATSDDPYNAMCENVVANLMASSQLEFSGSRAGASDNDLTASLNFARGSNEGTAVCYYAKIEDEDELDDEFETSPYKVVLNDRTVSNQELMAATFNATKGMIKETAQETSEQMNEMAREASEKAREVAGSAAETARDVAGNAAEKARNIAHDAAEKVQRSLEK